MCRRKPSAMGLRQTLPVQTKRIFFMGFFGVARWLAASFRCASLPGQQHDDGLQNVHGALQHHIAHVLNLTFVLMFLVGRRLVCVCVVSIWYCKGTDWSLRIDRLPVEY